MALSDWMDANTVINNYYSSTPLAITQGGTGASTAANALTNLGAASMTLLWENGSMGSSFSAQTVNISGLSNYTHVLILLSTSHSNYGGIQVHSNIVKVGDTACLYAPNINYSDSADFWLGLRCCSVTSSGITFSNGGFTFLTESYYSWDGDHAIPYKIYGIKIR